MGATVSAFDVSSQAIDNAGLALSKAGLSERCTLQVMPAEKLSYADSTFDLAVGFAILHHLEVKSALSELHRVLRPGGVAFFAEPLGTNPALQLYRRLTPQFRTEDERPLVLAELPDQLRAFRSFTHRECYLSALAAVGLAYLPGGARLFPTVSSALHKMDDALLSAFPRLGNWAWYTILEISK
jgi:SAM-dependent methyltransferase